MKQATGWPRVIEKNNVCMCMHIAGHQVILPSGKLFISSVTWSDVGVYRCVAVNPLTASRRVSTSSVSLVLQGSYENAGILGSLVCWVTKLNWPFILDFFSDSPLFHWVTGVRGLMSGVATLPLGNQELLVVRDNVGRPPGELGVSKSMECDISLQCFDTVGWATGRASGLYSMV